MEVAFAVRPKRLGRFVILRETVTTFGQKLRARSAVGKLGVGFRLASVKKRDGQEFWYGSRDEGRPVRKATD